MARLKLKEFSQVFVVDVKKQDQLLSAAKQCRVLLNCVGPYRYSGEDVVKACIAAGTDYLDVSGEPGVQFLHSVVFQCSVHPFSCRAHAFRSAFIGSPL